MLGDHADRSRVGPDSGEESGRHLRIAELSVALGNEDEDDLARIGREGAGRDHLQRDVRAVQRAGWVPDAQ
jgi:hypothetical protein